MVAWQHNTFFYTFFFKLKRWRKEAKDSDFSPNRGKVWKNKIIKERVEMQLHSIDHKFIVEYLGEERISNAFFIAKIKYSSDTWHIENVLLELKVPTASV